MRVTFGRCAARKGDQVRFLLAVQLALPARPRSVIDGGLQSFLHVPLPRSGDRGRVDQQHIGYLWEPGPVASGGNADMAMFIPNN